MKQAGTLTIGSLAKQAGVGTQTIRFYERKGLLRQPARRPSGYRQYSREEAKRIRFIRRAQELGFTLSEIKDFLELRISARATCRDVKARTDQKLDEIESKIQDLKRMQRSLKKLSVSCTGSVKTSTSGCPILDCFEGKGC